MTLKIHIMTKNEAGHYNLSGNIAPDLFDGNIPEVGDPLDDALSDLGYARDNTGEFVGWGDVYWHPDTGEMLSVQTEESDRQPAAAEQILLITVRAEDAVRAADIPGLREVSVCPHDGESNTHDPAKITAALRDGTLTVRVDLHYWRGGVSEDLNAERRALESVEGVADMDWDGDGGDDYGPIESGILTIEGIRDPGHYRIMDRTGGQVTEDIEEDIEEDAVERGRDWIEAGDWSEPWDGDDSLYETVDLPCVVAPHIYRIECDGSTLDHKAMEADSLDCTGRYQREQPDCEASDDGKHDWRAPHHLVGGVRENPGVWSTGGTSMSVTEVCARCGIYRITRTPGSQRNPDEPIESVRFSPADEASEQWVESLREEEVAG